MGTNCAPLLANIYLHCYEFEYINKLRDLDIKKARKFSNTYRFIDDLSSVNNPLFEDAIKEIYPRSLTVNRENSDSNLNANYLDITISIKDKKFITNIYDKRDDFNFKINSFPHASSKIHLNSTAHVYYAQLIRIAYICSDVNDFHIKHKKLVEKLLDNGFSRKKLIKILKKFFHSNTDLLKKWKYQANQFNQYMKCAFGEE
jgi:thymidylate synthase ThyX